MSTIHNVTINCCVIPAAGLGTRFLPATRVLPKELLPVLDKPVIQWGVEEAVAAGARRIVIVISKGKELVAAHFADAPELESILAERGKERERAIVHAVGKLADFSYAYQDVPLGLGHAVLCARDAVGNEPFMCLLPDDLSYGDRPLLTQLIEGYDRFATSILSLMKVSKEKISRYGCATVKERNGRFYEVVEVVEKPSAEDAASDLAIMGRYVLMPSIFAALQETHRGVGGEIQLTDAFTRLIAQESMWGVRFDGELLDVGTPRGWLETNIRLANEVSWI